MVTSAHAENAVSYSFLEVGYVNSELDDLNVDGNGFGIRGSYAFTDLIHGFASYADQDYDFDIGVSQLEAGIGLNKKPASEDPSYTTPGDVSNTMAAEVAIAWP